MAKVEKGIAKQSITPEELDLIMSGLVLKLQIMIKKTPGSQDKMTRVQKLIIKMKSLKAVYSEDQTKWVSPQDPGDENDSKTGTCW